MRTRIPIEQVTNGMKLQRWQIQGSLIFAETVPLAQETGLSRAVGDCRSRVRDTHNLCGVLDRKRGNDQLRVRVDKSIVHVMVPDFLVSLCDSIVVGLLMRSSEATFRRIGTSGDLQFSWQTVDPSTDDIDPQPVIREIIEPRVVPQAVA
jgi:hypothetical protein